MLTGMYVVVSLVLRNDFKEHTAVLRYVLLYTVVITNRFNFHEMSHVLVPKNRYTANGM